MKLIVNFKCYKHGKDSVKLAKLCKALIKKKDLILVPEYTEISQISKLGLDVFAQHIDYIDGGRSTGYVHPLAVKKAGAKGTLLNHAEHRLDFKVLKKSIQLCKKLKLKTIVCSPSVRQTKKIMKLKSDYIAFEDPKLISTGVSISQVEPGEVKKFVKLLERTKIIPLCGSGVSTGEDVRKAKELGTKGVLVASAIAKPKNSKKVLKDFAKNLK